MQGNIFHRKDKLPDMPKLISIDEAAEQLGVSTRTVRRLISEGKLPAYRVSELVRIKADDLEKLLRPIVPSGKMGY